MDLFLFFLSHPDLVWTIRHCSRLWVEAEHWGRKLSNSFTGLRGLPSPKTMQQNPTADHPQLSTGPDPAPQGPHSPPSQPRERGYEDRLENQLLSPRAPAGWTGWSLKKTSALHRPISSFKINRPRLLWQSDLLIKIWSLCFPVFQQAAHPEGPFMPVASVWFLAQM